jgi:phosphate transport system protein
MSRHGSTAIDELRLRLVRESGLVASAVERAVSTIDLPDESIARQIISDDAAIDAEEVCIEQCAIEILALHSPAASELRMVTTVIKINAELERIADCASNIATRVLQVFKFDQYQPPEDLRVLGRQVLGILRATDRVLHDCDCTRAEEVRRSDPEIDASYGKIVADAVARMQTDGQLANADLSTIMTAKNLERIADHCTNIAEDVIYAMTGNIVRRLKAV